MTWCIAEPARPGGTAWRAVAAAALMACGAALAPLRTRAALPRPRSYRARRVQRPHRCTSCRPAWGAARGEARRGHAPPRRGARRDRERVLNAEGAARTPRCGTRKARDFKGRAPRARWPSTTAAGLPDRGRLRERTRVVPHRADAELVRRGARFWLATLMFLDGWCSQMLGDTGQAAEAYAEVAKERTGHRLRPTPACWWWPSGRRAAQDRRRCGQPRDRLPPRQAHAGKAHRDCPGRHAAAPVPGWKTCTCRPPTAARERSTASSTAGQLPEGHRRDRRRGCQPKRGRVDQRRARRRPAALGGLAAAGAIVSLVSANVKPRADVRYRGQPARRACTGTLGPCRAAGRTEAVRRGRATGGQRRAGAPRMDRPKGRRPVWIKTRR